MSYLLTFVVPTRNRMNCAISLLDTFDRFHNEFPNLFNVVILDNSDDDGLRNYCQNKPYDISYKFFAEQLSVVDNFNLGSRNIAGDYACFIGDDDLISIRIFEIVMALKGADVDAAIVAPEAKAIYFWPGVVDARWGDVGGKLFLTDYSGKMRLRGADRAIREARRRISDGPLRLPRAYSGVIATRCINQVIERHGALFGGASPDIYSSRLLASVVENYYEVDFPFLVAGASKTSTSAARSERSDVGGLKDNDHLGRFAKLSWDERVPEFYSPFTVWAQSYIQAENELGGKVGPLSFAYLYAKCLLFARGNSRHVGDAIKQWKKTPSMSVYIVFNLIRILFEFFIQKVPLIFRRKPGATKYALGDLENSFLSNASMDEMLSSTKIYNG